MIDFLELWHILSGPSRFSILLSLNLRILARQCDFSVSPRSKSFFFSFFRELLFNLGVCWDRGSDPDFDQGLTILLFSFFGGLLFNLGVCWDRGLDLDPGLTSLEPSIFISLAQVSLRFPIGLSWVTLSSYFIG